VPSPPPPAAPGLFEGQGPVLSAVAAGGALGALARWGAGVVFAAAAPWTTLAVNVLGCLLIGVLVALVADVVAAPPLARPFLGTGVLGGFTTFSGFALDGRQLLLDGRPGAAAGYLAATLAGALLATWVGLALVRLLAGSRR
jgi:fluoride exporter